jgi:hypothetical protein
MRAGAPELWRRIFYIAWVSTVEEKQREVRRGGRWRIASAKTFEMRKGESPKWGVTRRLGRGNLLGEFELRGE